MRENLSYAIEVVDSHTEGEPTRMVHGGFPELRGATMQERLDDFRANHDRLRTAIIHEPRGYDAVVAAILTPPVTPGALTGVIYCNDLGYLRMCGHATIGVIRSLQYLGRITPGQTVVIDTIAGSVGCELHPDGSVSIRNVPSYAHALDVTVEVPGIGNVTGDIAYGGNWFFIAPAAAAGVSALEYDRLPELLQRGGAIREALAAAGMSGLDGACIDHIELTGRPVRADAHARNFVFCGRNNYDRSPCGTGTSAKMVTVAERGELLPGQEWRQEGILGTLLTGHVERSENAWIPTIRGRAWITGTSVLIGSMDDPFVAGITSRS